MEAWKKELYGNQLYHHGILGQRWGTRNGPPYPLSAGARSKSEQKAAHEEQTRHLSTNSAGSEYTDLAISVITPLMVLTTARLIGMHKATKRMQKEAEKNKESNTENIKIRISGPHSEAEDMEAVNLEGYNTGELKHRMNCTMCTAAYELRRRGFDVKANTSEFGRLNKQVISWYKLNKDDIKSSKKYDDFLAEINKYPEGSRGQLICGVGIFNSGHSMLWERKDNAIIIRDCQTNTVYNSIDDSIINKKSNRKPPYMFFRTDNVDIEWNNIRDAVVPRK